MTDGEKLKQRLLETGMKKTEFARRYGTSSQNVYMLFKTKEFRKDVKNKIEKILEFKFEPNFPDEYKMKYFDILKKYTEILEENKMLNKDITKLKKMLL